MNEYLKYLDITIGSNTVRDYLMAVGIFIGALILFKIFKSIILTRIEKWAKKTKADIDDVILKIIEDIPGIFYVFIAVYISLKYLKVDHLIGKIFTATLIILAFYWATKAASSLIEYLLNKIAKKRGKEVGGKTSSYFALTLVAKIVLWSTGLLLILSNLGVNITAFAASLGIGGIAVALALQNILGDLFSSFSIYIDKPFEVGDFIIVGDHMGDVKKIGLKSTRVTSLQGEEIVFSNHELTTARIRNFKKMKKRRIVFGFGVTYDTPVKKLKKIPKIIKEIFAKVKKTELDRAHFKEFADSSLTYEIVYYIQSGAYVDYMDAQQKINLMIKEAFEKEGIDMAFPTRTVHMVKEK